MAHDDPIAELSWLLAEESLEERFQRVLVSAFRRISDGGYYPARDLLEVVEMGSAVQFAKNWLGDDRAQPLFDLLISRRREDLTVEWYVARPPYLRLFDEGDCDIYRHRVASSAQRDPWLHLWRLREPGKPTTDEEFAQQAIVNLESDPVYKLDDMITLQRRRSIEFGPFPIQEQIAALEKEIEAGYPFTCSSRILQEAHDRNIRDRYPLFTSEVDNVRQDIRGLFAPHLNLFRPLFDFSPKKIAEVEALLNSDGFDDLFAPEVLAFRAAFVCSAIGQLIPQIAAIYFGGESHETEIHDLASYFPASDACLVTTAAVLSRMFRRDELFSFNVISFGDLPETSLIHHKQFDPEEDLPREGLEDDTVRAVNVAGIVRFVMEATKSRVRTRDQAITGLPAAELLAEATDPQASPGGTVVGSARQWQIMLEIAGKTKRAESERRLRAKMGKLFDHLCPEAKSSLLGAEFTLLDEHWHPGPSQALIGMSTAFERELKESFLVPLADFLACQNTDRFPAKDPVIVDGSPKEGLPLDRVSRAMREEREVWVRFCEVHGFDFAAVRSALRQVRDPRNKAAHEGNISFDYVRECRERWLDPVRGIFSVLARGNEGAKSA
jgi:hypothetical protein